MIKLSDACKNTISDMLCDLIFSCAKHGVMSTEANIKAMIIFQTIGNDIGRDLTQTECDLIFKWYFQIARDKVTTLTPAEMEKINECYYSVIEGCLNG